VIPNSIKRRLCAECGSAIGEPHTDECPVDRHAPIVEVEYIRADQLAGAVADENEKLRRLLWRIAKGEPWSDVAAEVYDATGTDPATG